MRIPAHRAAQYGIALTMAVAVATACGFDDSLREYLYTLFWQPFAKSAADFARPVPTRPDPFAGMGVAESATPLARLRLAYRSIAAQTSTKESLDRAVAEARAVAPSLPSRDREEVDLIDVKIQLRLAVPVNNDDGLESAITKLDVFLRNARDPLWRSEARGWLAHIYYVRKNWSAAGKIYLDELNRPDSNLSRKTLLASLSLTYGYSGRKTLLPHIEEYFDTPEHAAFAVTLVTNPQWEFDQAVWRGEPDPPLPPVPEPPPWESVNTLLQKHSRLFTTERGSALLTELGMRVALRAADPEGALKIAERTPESAPVRRQPDFLWMLAASRFLTHKYQNAEAPLLALFRARAAEARYRVAAAYALCGVYSKTGNYVEQLRMALWLHDNNARISWDQPAPASAQDMSVYWAMSGFDPGALLDYEAPDEALRAFANKYPSAKQVRLVRYAIAVRQARAERYAEAATIFQSINAPSRARRMQRPSWVIGETLAAVMTGLRIRS